MSNRPRGWKHSPKTIAKMKATWNDPMRRLVRSQQALDAIKRGALGAKTWKPDSKNKVRAAQVAYWSDPKNRAAHSAKLKAYNKRKREYLEALKKNEPDRDTVCRQSAEASDIARVD